MAAFFRLFPSSRLALGCVLWAAAAVPAAVAQPAANATAPAPAPAAASAPERPRDPALDHLIAPARMNAWRTFGDGSSTDRVACEALGRSCLRLTLTQVGTNPWDSGATLPVTGEIRKGDRLQVLLWARLDTDDPLAKVQVPVLLQLSEPPYTGLLFGTARLSSKLEPVVLTGAAPADQAPGTVMLSVQTGQVGRPILLSVPFVLRNYTPPK